jgi:hypothetical protein
MKNRIHMGNGGYEQVKIVRGPDYWGGSKGYNPETDPFYRRLVTFLNNPDNP